MKEKKYPGKALGAILIVLLLMPLGHALMILMEHFLTPTRSIIRLLPWGLWDLS